METRFENRYTRQKEDLREYYSKVILKNQRSTAVVMMFVCAGGIVFAGVMQNYEAILLFCACLAVFLMIFFTPFLMARTVEASSLRLHNGQRHEMVIRFGELIESSEGTVNIAFEYSQIVGVRVLTNTVALMIDKRTGLLLRKDSFVTGRYEEFLDFIRRECPNLQYVK